MTVSIEELLRPWLADRPGVTRACTELPADLVDHLPLVQVVGIGGSGDRFGFDALRVDVDAFDSTRGAARTLAYSLRDDLLTALPGVTLGSSAFVLSVAEFSAPTWVPDENTAVRRFTLSVEIRLHTRSTS